MEEIMQSTIPRRTRSRQRCRSGSRGWNVDDVFDRMSPPHGERLGNRHGLATRLAKCKIDRFGLRVHPEALHHPTKKFFVEVDVRSGDTEYPLLTPSWCTQPTLCSCREGAAPTPLPTMPVTVI